jgi:hypothetical protein
MFTYTARLEKGYATAESRIVLKRLSGQAPAAKPLQVTSRSVP